MIKKHPEAKKSTDQSDKESPGAQGRMALSPAGRGREAGPANRGICQGGHSEMRMLPGGPAAHWN